MSTGKAFRAALTEKYSKLAAEAKTHSNPENYIHSKYFDKSSEYYETNLTDTERRIAYNYEMQMCRTGKINGVNYQDSLFRGIEDVSTPACFKIFEICEFTNALSNWILSESTLSPSTSIPLNKESKMKYEAYHQVYSYTGYELDKLEEKNGTYYTESGENILDLVDKAVEDSGKVPKEFKQQMKNWIHDLVSTMSTKGWNNVPDMTLSILYF